MKTGSERALASCSSRYILRFIPLLSFYLFICILLSGPIPLPPSLCNYHHQEVIRDKNSGFKVKRPIFSSGFWLRPRLSGQAPPLFLLDISPSLCPAVFPGVSLGCDLLLRHLEFFTRCFLEVVAVAMAKDPN